MRDLFHELAIARQQAEETYDRDVMNAWRVEFFARQKTLTAPTKFLIGAKKHGPDSPQTMRESLHKLAAMYGGKVRPVKKKGGP